MAVAAIVFCISFTIEASAQAFLTSSSFETNEQRSSANGTEVSLKPHTSGGIVNLNYAFAAEIRAFKPFPLPDNNNDDKEKNSPPANVYIDIPVGNGQPLPDNSLERYLGSPEKPYKFQWGGALKQSLYFLGIMHSFRFITEGGTRAELRGPFFKDYFKAMRGLRGWKDGDPFIVNYVGHPLQGSVSGFIQIHNDPKGINEELSLRKSYWMSRLKAFGWSAALSTQFELGPLSEASLGNIGIRPTKKWKRPMAYVDLVVTPTLGTVVLVGEDALDRYVISRYETRLPNRTTVFIFRSILNPSRGFANVLRGKWPWYRDNRL